jgi:8-oxo-dGTP pyrophosphatase MutT (NUDIX family)
MFVKIYFDQKPLFLCDSIEETLEPYLHHDDAVFIDELSVHTVKTMLHEMELSKIHAGIFFHPDLEALKKAFWKKFRVLQAAGGLVENDRKEVLMIFRRGKWDLPKGKLEPGESMEVCAGREVMEETGIAAPVIKKFLQVTYHTYYENGLHILKESYWYLMKSKGHPDLIPQLEEDITQARWVGKKDLNALFPECFASVREVLGSYLGG